MANGYEEKGKYRGGEKDREKKDCGVGKNDQHGDSETHSRNAKGNRRRKGE